MKKSKIKRKGIIGFAQGMFDFVHAGHILLFKYCKKHCDHLVVALQTDRNKQRAFKNRPIQSVEERKIQLEGCKYIDEIITYRTEPELLALLKKVNPDIHFHGADHKGAYYTGQELGIPIKFFSRDHGYSSKSLRERVLKAEKKN